MYNITGRLQRLDLRVNSVLMRADSIDGNEIVLGITASSARSIHFVCRIYLVLTKKKTKQQPTIPFQRLLQRKLCGWTPLNYCGAKIEDKRVQSDTVSEAQSVLLLQGNISAFRVFLFRNDWCVCVCVYVCVCVCICVVFLHVCPSLCLCTVQFLCKFSLFSTNCRGFLVSLKASVCVCVCVCSWGGTSSVWTCDKVLTRSAVSCRRTGAVFISVCDWVWILPPGSAF